ncbi:hypothetical protein SH2C18_39390 [Clostridium sediminicola]|uniref:protein phosphatase 2C domain-containing protein n=1 Tax=Clostridium sediminicola TaxID=3114879 RepID=UPI0031F1C753
MKIDHITNTFKENNEDGYGITKHSFWVIDGASSLNKNNYTDEGNDVVWMVNWWNKYLNETIEQLDRTIIDILETGVIKLNEDYSKFVDIESLSKLDRASAGISIARINKETLECFVLGDVEINLKTKSGDIKHLSDGKIKCLDKEVISLMLNNPNREKELVFKGFTKNELKLLRNNRMKMNTKDGYYILEHEKESIKKGIYKEFKLKDIDEVLLMSDGYAQLYNNYRLSELFIECKTRGVKNLLEELRSLEKNDKAMRSRKRLKLHDDCTAIYFDVSECEMI